MRRLKLALALVTASAVARGAGLDDAAPVATDRVIVRLAPGASSAELAALLERANARLDAVLTQEPLRALLRAPSPPEGAALAAELATSGRVAYAVPEVFRPMELRGRYVPNDPLFAAQWALDNTSQAGEDIGGGDVDAPQAWAHTLGSPAITIAVLDDGVQLAHPDLKPNIAAAGRDFTVYPPAEGAQPRRVADRHGTAVAGIAAARGDNGLGVSGICPRCTILPIRVRGSSNLGVAEAFRYAVAQGADVITNSWGYAPRTSRRAEAAVDAAVRDAIDSAAREGRGGRGTLIVFGMTNEAVDNCGAHADISALESVVAVGVSDHNDMIGGSGFGACMDLVAPAKPERRGTTGSATTDRVGLDGYADGDYFTVFGGTSAAAPLVAGIAGLLLSLNPDLTREDLQRILEHTADKIDPAHAAYDAAGFSEVAGHGRVNAARALTPSVKITVTPSRVAPGEPFSVTVAASAPLGLRSVSWRGSATGDAALDGLRLQSLGGEPYRSITWPDLVVERPGTYQLEASAEGLRAAEPAPDYPHPARTEAGGMASLTVVERADDDSR